MKKLVIAAVVSTPLFLLSGCVVDTVVVSPVVYDEPGCTSDYVYSVGYYNVRPYWGNNYYNGCWGNNYWGNNVYWGGGAYNGY